MISATTCPSARSNESGYDYTFVDTPPDHTVCTICHLPSRNPHLSECCGHVFCKSCLDARASSCTNCPVCIGAKLVTFYSEKIDQEVKKSKVYCTNKKKGCKWIGELKDLACHHKNSDGCKCVVVKCSNDCGMMLQRKKINKHLRLHCRLRNISCKHCHKVGVLQFIKGDHKNECQKIPVCCPNRCGTGTILRENMKAHMEECPLEMIDCEYHNVGCEVRVVRKGRMRHEEANVNEHLQMTKRKLCDTEERLAILESKIHHLTSSSYVSHNQQTLVADWSNHLAMLTRMATSIQVCPVIFRLHPFTTYEANDSCWHSDCFYTQNKGYMMRLLVYAGGRGIGKGTHLSVYLQLWKGAYDDELTWPLTGEFLITLLNQISDDKHHSYQLRYDDNTPLDVKSKITVKANFSTWGSPNFISNAELKTANSEVQFLKNDCIYMQVCTKVIYYIL